MANPSRGWQVGLSLSQSMSYRLENQLECDVTFRFTSQSSTSTAKTTLGAHKYMLASRSPVFEAMLSGNFAESSKDVEIVDIDNETFFEMLRYIYTDEPSITADNVIPLMMAARKYIIDGLSAKCATFLKTQISEHNVCTILTDCLANSEEDLANHCIKYIGPSIAKIISSDGFMTLSHQALLAILKSDQIQVNSELALFEACIKWAMQNGNAPPSSVNGTALRKQLGPCLKQIRLWDIPPAEFSKLMANFAGILQPEEATHVYGYMLSKNDFNKETLLQMNFNMQPRKQAYTTLGVFDSPASLDYGLGINDECIEFQTNVDGKLFGIGLLGCNEGGMISINLRLDKLRDQQRQRNEDMNHGFFGAFNQQPQAQFGFGMQHANEYKQPTSQEIASKNQRSTSKQNAQVIPVMFDNPVNIQSTQKYSLTLSVEGEPRYYGTGGNNILCSSVNGVSFEIRLDKDTQIDPQLKSAPMKNRRQNRGMVFGSSGGGYSSRKSPYSLPSQIAEFYFAVNL